MRHSISLCTAIVVLLPLSLSALCAPVEGEASSLTARADDGETGGGGMKSHIIIPLVILPVLAVLTVALCAVYIWRRASIQRARRLSALDVKLSARSTSTAGADSRPDSFVQAVDSKRHSRRASSSDAVLAVELGKVFGGPPASPPAAKTREHRTGSALTPLPEQ
ncbi:hypothetical protein AURDEDRAFT_153725 [Auricularia subglabra TFB-10046 SS5]|nr:hypothetical protein AURDEDRAFT_153725 [Auricularia subglabra TFB-10046 SS5]